MYGNSNIKKSPVGRTFLERVSRLKRLQCFHPQQSSSPNHCTRNACLWR